VIALESSELAVGGVKDATGKLAEITRLDLTLGFTGGSRMMETPIDRAAIELGKQGKREMYETFFHLKQRPLCGSGTGRPATFRPRRSKPLVNIGPLHRERGRGSRSIFGFGRHPGWARRSLCQLLAEQFRDTFEIALLSNGHLGARRELLQAILFRATAPLPAMDEASCVCRWSDHLSGEGAGRVADCC